MSSAGRYGSVPFPIGFLILALLVGGLIEVVTNFRPILGSWPWEMPHLAHRFLAGAAAAYLVGGAVTLARGMMGRERSAPGDAATAVGALVYAVPSRAGLVWPWSALPAWSDPPGQPPRCFDAAQRGLGALFALWRDDRGVARLLVLMVWAYWVVVGSALVLHAAAEPAFLLPDAVYVWIFAVIAAAGAGALLRRGRV